MKKVKIFANSLLMPLYYSLPSYEFLLSNFPVILLSPEKKVLREETICTDLTRNLILTKIWRNIFASEMKKGASEIKSE